MLDTPNAARERVLLMGSYGSGKSYARVALWRWLVGTGAPGRLFVVDTDASCEREALELGEQYLPSIALQPAYEWGDFQVVGDWRQHATRDDWLIVDRVDKAWTAAQDDIIQRMFGVDAAELFVEHQAKAGKGRPLPNSHAARGDAIKRGYA